MINLLPYSKLIRKPSGVIRKISSVFMTDDIIKSILHVNKNAYLDVVDFTHAIPSNNVMEIAESLYYFVLNNIRYVEDVEKIKNDPIYQAVKRPAKFWADREGDCKSYTIFITSVLRAKGIPYVIRFVSYSQNPVYTHVYPLAIDTNGKAIIIDPVWGRVGGSFNTEKEYKLKKDYKMSGLYEMSGIGETNLGIVYKSGMLRVPDNWSDEAMEASIYKQRMEIERDIIASQKGSDHPKVKEFDRSISVLSGFIGALERDDFESVDAIISGIGNSMGKTVLQKLADKAKEAGNKIKAAAQKTLQTVAKGVSAPARLVAKGAIELVFPSIAPAFLYLFINDPALLNKVPAAVRVKRQKQQKIASFIIDSIGMKQDHFMGILRNGIMKKTGKSPEAILAAQFKGISGIGFIAIAATILPIILKWIPKIAELFGKKADGLKEVAESMLPEDGDVIVTPATQTASKEVATSLIRKAAYTEPGTTLDKMNTPDPGETSLYDGTGGKRGSRGICG